MSELPHNTKFTTFLHSFAGHWGVLVTGIASVPFTLAWLLLGDKSAKYVFGALALACLVAASYFVWRDQRKVYLSELERNGKPEIKIRLLKALHHMLQTESGKGGGGSIYLGPSFVTLQVGLVNARDVATTISGYDLKVFIGRTTFSGTLVPNNVRFAIGREKALEHSSIDEPLVLHPQKDVETIIPLSDTITSANPLKYLLEQRGYLHFLTDLPVFEYEMQDEKKFPKEFIVVLTLADPAGGKHIGRFEKIAIEPEWLAVVGSLNEQLLREKACDPEGKTDRLWRVTNEG